ncbi:MAG: hypothetical protein ABSH41_10460 [Syntrophobacteraceae bacterium]|jgi:hypothetical protein
MPHISMPPTFPQDEFQKFLQSASKFFPPFMSNDDLNDPLRKLLHIDWAWQAVRYRYRSCWEYNEAFKALFANASDLWREWGVDEELNYKIEQCVYHFFMSGLSIFESLGFCLYFIGSGVSSAHFPKVNKPRLITLEATKDAFTIACPKDSISDYLAELLEDKEFKNIDGLRNILAHRLSGRRNIREYGSTQPDGTYTHTREEVWYIPDSEAELIFDEELLQRPFDEITRLLKALISASLEFVVAH